MLVSESQPPFIGREAELAELRELASSGKPALALLYGRRRVGKTYLLDHAFRGTRYFYFLASDTTTELNKRELLGELAPLLPDPSDTNPELFPSWRHVFRQFVALANRDPLVVVLDEFQYLMDSGDEDIPSQLMAVWDREVNGAPLLLVLCGSEVSTLESLKSGAGPLFGRWSWGARLRAFDYYDSAKMLPGRPHREQALAYGILGGTPRFLAAVGPGDNLSRQIAQTVLSPRGIVRLQLERIIEQERGIRNPGDYQAVLSAVARGNTEINEIAQATGLSDPAVRRVLAVLEDLELTMRERNYGAAQNAAWRHYIADNALRFWYRFVQPNRSRLETGNPHYVWAGQVAPNLNQYMGKVFERISQQVYERLHSQLGWQPAAEWGRWEGQDRNRRSIEIDIVSRLTGGKMLTGEVKWSSSPIGPGVHMRLLDNLEALAASGQGWAKDALNEQRSVGHLYVSSAGFTPEFRHMADLDERIRLVDFEDMYARFE